MKYLLFLLFILSSSNSFAQSNLELGLGIVTVNIDALPKISFYSDTVSKIPVKSISVIKDKNQELVIKNIKQNAWLKSEGRALDYNIFIFRCTKKRGNWCEVYVNNTNRTKYWIKLNKNLSYLNWSKYLDTQTTWVGKRDEYSLEVKQSPNESSKRIKMMEKDDCFVVLEVKGDWMKVKTNDVLNCSGAKYPVKSGWIRWRKNNRLLIEYGLSC